MNRARELDRFAAQAVIADFTGALLDLSPTEVAAIHPGTCFDAEGLGIDSVGLLELATAVSTFFRLHETELEDELLRRRSVRDWTNTIMRAWAFGTGQLTFMTSGTSGKRVPCTHRWSRLVQELDVHAGMFADRRRIVGLVGPRHIYGFLFCALLPQWLDIPFVDARGTAPAGLASSVQPGDLVIGFPLRWDLITAGERWPADIVGVTSTGPIAATTVDSLRSQGLARMVEIYGSTETGGIAWRDDPAEPLQPYAHWSLQHDGKLVRNAPEAGSPPEIVEPPDVLRKRGRGFDVIRRRDGAVQIAGTNVSCTHVADILVGHPCVRECAVRPMRADEGSRLKAFIVLAGPVTEDDARSELRAWMPAHLSAAETPASFDFGVSLPRDAHGKLIDWPARAGRHYS